MSETGRGGRARRRGGVGVLVAAAVGLSTARAHASPLTLVWDAPAGCPTAAAVTAEIERLAHAPSATTPSGLSAEAHIEQRGTRWHLRLHTVRNGAAGERVLEADSCASLAHAATLVLVLALGEGAEPPLAPPRAPPRSPVAARPPTPPQPAAPVPPVLEPAPPPPAPAPARAPAPALVVTMVARPVHERFAWAVTGEARLGYGPLPAGVGYGAGVDVGGGRWLAMVRAFGWPTDDERTLAGGVRARYAAAGGTLSACAVAWRGAWVALAGCLGAGATAVRGASAGAPFDRSAVAPWYTVEPALRLRVRLVGALHAEARAAGTTSLNRPRFALDNFGDVYTVRRFAPAALLGLSVDI